MTKKIIALEFFGYLCASACALLVDFSFFVFALRVLEWSWLVSSSLGFSLGVFVAYFISVRLVFKTRKYLTAPYFEGTIFFVTGLVGVVVTILVLWFCIEILFLPPELSKVVSAGFTFISNFLARKLLLFRNKNQDV